MPWSRRPSAMTSARAPRVLDHQDPHAGHLPARPPTAVSGRRRRPPSGRARRTSVPPCAAAMAATIDRPSPVPAPSGPVRPSRWNGWPSRATCSGSRTGPPVSTTSSAACSASTRRYPDPAAVVVVGDRVVDRRCRPSGPAARRCRGSRRRAAPRRGPSAAWPRCRRRGSRQRLRDQRRRRRPGRGRRARRAARGPASRKPSSSWSTRSSSVRSRSGERDRLRRTGSGFATATSSDARIVASGVRSSWEALATNRRWAANDASSRSSSSSMVSARRLDLVGRAGDGQPLVQVVGGDPAGRRGDRPQRAQHPPGHAPGRAAPRRPPSRPARSRAHQQLPGLIPVHGLQPGLQFGDPRGGGTRL